MENPGGICSPREPGGCGPLRLDEGQKAWGTRWALLFSDSSPRYIHIYVIPQPGYSATLLGPRYVPQEISTPHARLTGECRTTSHTSPSSKLLVAFEWFCPGHDSIVNTALCHPYEPYILTAGIERFIRLHSPTAASPSTEPLPPTPKGVRTIASSSPGAHDVFLRAMGMLDDGGLDDDNGDDDSQSIMLFDQCVRFLVFEPWIE